LLDEVLAVIPEQQVPPPTAERTEPAAEVKVAIIGRPNVGKSTLLNQLTGMSRAIVSPVAGTTRDAVDEVIERDGNRLRFIDTAGIRRKGKTELMAEKLSVVMARKHLEAADIALLMIDATEGVTASDATIGGYAHESGRSSIIVVNKWDLVGSGRSDGKPAADRNIFEQQVRNTLKFLSYAPVVFISATTGKNTDKIFELLKEVAAERRKRISTAEMNRFLAQVDFERASVPARKDVKIRYMTQAAVSPPTFILFTDRAVSLHFSYQRFLENQIRRAFGFVGTPIWIKNRARG
jgi:GTP-binding protein